MHVLDTPSSRQFNNMLGAPCLGLSHPSGGALLPGASFSQTAGPTQSPQTQLPPLPDSHAHYHGASALMTSEPGPGHPETALTVSSLWEIFKLAKAKAVSPLPHQILPWT